MTHQHSYSAITRDGHTVWLCEDCKENAGTYIDGSCLVCDACYNERMTERFLEADLFGEA